MLDCKIKGVFFPRGARLVSIYYRTILSIIGVNRMETKNPQSALKNAIKISTLIKSDMENLLGIHAQVMWSYYLQLKNEGFTDDQAFELVKNASPKHLEIKLKQ